MRLLPLLAVLLLSAACRTASTAASESGATSAPTRDRSVMLLEDMERATGVNNLYEAVQRLRPDWLKTRGGYANQMNRGQVMDPITVVYIDGQRSGELEMLKSMPIRGLAALRFYSASKAQVKFGTGNMAPVIEVVTSVK